MKVIIDANESYPVYSLRNEVHGIPLDQEEARHRIEPDRRFVGEIGPIVRWRTKFYDLVVEIPEELFKRFQAAAQEWYAVQDELHRKVNEAPRR